jgi:hypothetical protein
MGRRYEPFWAMHPSAKVCVWRHMERERKGNRHEKERGEKTNLQYIHEFCGVTNGRPDSQLESRRGAEENEDPHRCIGPPVT